MAALFDAALATMTTAGAILIPVDFQHFDSIFSFGDEIVVLFFDFHKDLDAYLASRIGTTIHTIDDVIAFNSAHANQELQFFGHALIVAARDTNITDPATIAAYNPSLDNDQLFGATEGIDARVAANSLGAIRAPPESPAWTTDIANGDP